MKTNLYQVGNTQVLAIQDAISQAEGEELRETILNSTSNGVGRIALDLSEVPFIDGASLEMLLRLSKECLAEGGRLKLVSLSANMEEILRLTDLRPKFEVHSSVEEATRRVL